MEQLIEPGQFDLTKKMINFEEAKREDWKAIFWGKHGVIITICPPYSAQIIYRTTLIMPQGNLLRQEPYIQWTNGYNKVITTHRYGTEHSDWPSQRTRRWITKEFQEHCAKTPLGIMGEHIHDFLVKNPILELLEELRIPLLLILADFERRVADKNGVTPDAFDGIIEKQQSTFQQLGFDVVKASKFYPGTTEDYQSWYEDLKELFPLQRRGNLAEIVNTAADWFLQLVFAIADNNVIFEATRPDATESMLKNLTNMIQSENENSRTTVIKVLTDILEKTADQQKKERLRSFKNAIQGKDLEAIAELIPPIIMLPHLNY